MLARLQQILTLSLLLGACAWLFWWWPRSPLWACAGFLTIALAYSAFLAIEFVALKCLGGAEPALRPRWRELLRAWWGETLAAPRVFCWRQPFFPNAVPDHLPRNGRRGVVFIHGFVCNRGFWTPWLRRLLADDRAFAAVSLEPVFGSIDAYAASVEDAVRRVTAATGQAPVLVCHSMGGLAARAWLRTAGAADRAHRVITIGTPHGGTWLGRFSHVVNGKQMRQQSLWLQQLQGDEPPGTYQRFTCWYSNCDNIVFPTSTATLPGADNRLLCGIAHVQLAFEAEVIEHSLRQLAAD